MRPVATTLAVIASCLGLLHCAAGSPTAGDSLDPHASGWPSADVKDAGAPPPKSNPAPTRGDVDAGPKVVADAGAGQPPPEKTPPPTPVAAPGPTCTALAACCDKLANSYEQVGCLLATGKKNELLCGGAMITFNCAAATNPSHGPTCAGLSEGALYCGNDGPSGDPNTLYQCNGGRISIRQQCANGCKINQGVDDACAAAGGTGGPPPSAGGVTCVGFQGKFCGADGVGGDPNTLYTCANSANPTSKEVCANGCVTNPNPSLNDTCATAPPAGGGTGGAGVSCAGLPDFKYCGSDGVKGDPSTLYTCVGGKLTGSMPCANGCTIGASNTDDYCS